MRVPTPKKRKKGLMDILESRIERVKQTASLQVYADSVLERRGASYVCPVCGSGTHKNGTTAFTLYRDTQSWHCFSCGSHGDVIDLAGAVTGAEALTDRLEALEEFAGIADGCTPTPTGRTSTPIGPDLDGGEAEEDYGQGRASEAAWVRQTQASMTPECAGAAYMAARGFSFEEVQREGIGWDAAHGRVVLPWGATAPWYHVDRAIAEGVQPKYTKPRTDLVGSQPVYETEGDGPLFVVEGVLDALAVKACGHRAIALCSTASRAAVNALEASDSTGPVVLMLDADKAGRDGQRRLVEALSGSVPVHEAEGMAWKDACEGLQADRAALAAFLDGQAQAAKACVPDTTEAAKPERPASGLVDPFEVDARIFGLEGAQRPIPTGLESLDDALGGGLRSGLYTLGAISSIGKTTLCVQLADQIAASGHPVLFVSIEQSAEEIAGKTLTRLMHSMGQHVSAQELTDPDARARWTAETNAAFAEALNVRESMAKTLRYARVDRQPTVSKLREWAEEQKALMGEAPIVFVDYLQLLKSEDAHDSDKQAVDAVVSGLRQLARDMQTAVVVTSSLNRSSYSGVVGLDSFKESGAIEYGSDVLMGLQAADMADQLAGLDEKKAKAKASRLTSDMKRQSTRRLELVILKNRNGRLADPVQLRFDSKAGWFY